MGGLVTSVGVGGRQEGALVAKFVYYAIPICSIRAESTSYSDV